MIAENLDLRAGYNYYASKVDALKAEIQGLKEARSQVGDENEETFGSWRLHITSDKWHSRHTDAAQSFFGFDSLEYTKEMVWIMFDLDHEEPEPSWITKKKSLTEFERCLMALMYYETDLEQKQLKLFFSVKKDVVSRAVAEWGPMWGEVGEQFSCLPFIDKELVDALIPTRYIEAGMTSNATNVDGKDYSSETVRVDGVIGSAQFSAKLGTSAFRNLTWSLLCGLICEATVAFLALAGEKAVLRLWGAHGRLVFPPGYIMTGDKGFEDTVDCYPNFNPCVHPAFLHGQTQFTPQQNNWNLEACQFRYTAETDYSRVTNRRKL